MVWVVWVVWVVVVVVQLTGRRHKCCHRKAGTNALRHGNNIRHQLVALETPEVAPSSSKSSLDLAGV